MVPMFLCLHVPSSSAHLEDLKDRLLGALATAPRELSVDARDRALLESLVDAVRAMDSGALTATDTATLFARRPVPGFDFGRWLDEMMDEGVYVETAFRAAA